MVTTIGDDVERATVEPGPGTDSTPADGSALEGGGMPGRDTKGSFVTMITRRFVVYGLFAGLALSSTGCCGIFRNFVYRLRTCGGCYHSAGIGGGVEAAPAFGGPIESAAPGFAGPAPVPGCSTCASGSPIGGPAGYAAGPGLAGPGMFAGAPLNAGPGGMPGGYAAGGYGGGFPGGYAGGYSGAPPIGGAPGGYSSPTIPMYPQNPPGAIAQTPGVPPSQPGYPPGYNAYAGKR